MNYGIIARKAGLFMISLPSDFDLQMISDKVFDEILNDESIRIKGITNKSIINLIDEAGDFIMNKDYQVVIKLQPHESEILMNGENTIKQFGTSAH